MEQQITELIEAIATIIITALGGFVTAKLKAYATTSSRQKTVATLATLATDAVVAVEKSGILNNLTAKQKYESAVHEVQKSLDKVGLKPVDDALIGNAIERAYSQQACMLHAVYGKQSEAAVAENKAQVANSAAQELADAKNAAEQAKQAADAADALVAEKQSALDAVDALAPVKED